MEPYAIEDIPVIYSYTFVPIITMTAPISTISMPTTHFRAVLSNINIIKCPGRTCHICHILNPSKSCVTVNDQYNLNLFQSYLKQGAFNNNEKQPKWKNFGLVQIQSICKRQNKCRLNTEHCL